MEMTTRTFRRDRPAASTAALLPGEGNYPHGDHPSGSNRRPIAAQAKCSKEGVGWAVGARLGALSSRTGVQGFGNVPVRGTGKCRARAAAGRGRSASPVTMYWESPEKAQSHIQPRDVSPGLLLLMLSSVIREKFEVLQILQV